MTLLQIREHGLNTSLCRRHIAIGIDLGTTNSLVATLRDGRAEILVDEQGRYLLPSVVNYQSQGHIVGFDARAKIVYDPTNTITSVKRMMGLSLSEIQTRYPRIPYKMEADENGLPVIVTSAGLLNPIQVSSDILKALVSRAVSYLGNKIDGAVIAVPAYFDDAQRKSTKDAACLAGLHVLRLINEPTAAAIAYGLESGYEGVIAVYDLGGGTFDISILCLSKGIFEVLATGGDSSLGGDDFDCLLADYIRKQMGINNRDDIYIQNKIVNAAINAKIALSNMHSVHIKVADWEGTITRKQFNRLILPLVNRTLLVCRQALKDANIEADKVLKVVMVGGSTRVPLILEYVSKFFNCQPMTSIDPDRAVAIGAAIQADILVGNKPDNEMLLLDVNPLSLGLEIMGGLVEKIIPRNTSIPAIRTQEFTTFKDGQTTMFIHVMQGERELVQDCRSLAQFVLRGIPALPAGKARVLVTFQIDNDCLLSVKAMEKSTGIESSIQVKPSYGLTSSKIFSMIQESISHAERDMEVRMLSEQIVQAERMIESLKSVLNNDAVVLNVSKRQIIGDAATQLRAAILSKNVDLIKETIKNVNEEIRDFARYMDLYLRSALKGQSVDDI